MKSNKLMIIMVCAVFAFAFGCSTVLWAAENGDGDQMKLPTLRLSAPLSSSSYAGAGEVLIVDDATLIITLQEADTETADGESVPGDLLDRVGYNLDSTGLSLVEHDGQVFLDRNGMQLQRRGLTADEVSAVPFAGPARAQSANGSVVIDSFSGEMNVTSDRDSGSLFVSVLDAQTKRLFTVTLGAIRGTGAGAGGSARDGSGQIVSHCEISGCHGGSGSIDCINKGCNCVCHLGDPVCVCTTKAALR